VSCSQGRLSLLPLLLLQLPHVMIMHSNSKARTHSLHQLLQGIGAN
jgi:hypothetical protein